ncbi:MAG: hypothetical protein V7672_10130 [Brevundimonas sp.]|uniref:hypothetical protein n=1 Tax=Brevundimonas sp. TaxID=1871086 RepID=UPI0030020FA1
MMTMTEQERVREGRARGRKLVAALAALVIGVAVALVVYGYIRAGVGATGTVAAVLGFGVGLALIAAIKAWTLRPWNRTWQLEPVQARRDRLQARRNGILWAFPVASLFFLAVSYQAWGGIEAGDDAVVDYLQVGLPVLYSWVVSMVVMGWDFQSRTQRKYLDDELTGALRARALGAAFVVLMASGTVAAGVSLWRPEWSPLAIITALTLGGAAAGLRFAWLDREAGLPERGDG